MAPPPEMSISISVSHLYLLREAGYATSEGYYNAKILYYHNIGGTEIKFLTRTDSIAWSLDNNMIGR